MRMKRDGRAVRGQQIKEEVREKILSRYIELLRAGTAFPTAAQIAKHAKLSRRVIFKRFADLGELRVVALERLLARSRSFFLRPISGDLSAEQRLTSFIEQQTAMFEEFAPFRRVALFVEQTEPLAATTMKRARAAAVRDIERAVRPAIGGLSAGEKRKLLLALHMICAWPSWETLRTHHSLPPGAARALITRSALTVLDSALRNNPAMRDSTGFEK